jgi:hypothetical protein
MAQQANDYSGDSSEAPASTSQAPASTSQAPVPPTFGGPPTVKMMEDPQPGDYWTYESRDEITGKLSGAITYTVTEATPVEISVRISAAGGSDLGFMVYDRYWNLKSNGSWTYSPNDGQGIKGSLRVGDSWAIKNEAVEHEHNAVWLRNGSAKVLVKDKIMTKAGLFETFMVESSYSLRRNNDTGSNHTEILQRTWYVPEIDHWVRRTVTSRTDQHLRSNSSTELTSYGRRQ